MKQKSPEQYNAQDLRQFWCREYKTRHNKDYQFAGFIGHELKELRELLEDNDIYSILCAIKTASNSSEINIHYFIDRFSSLYNPQTQYAKYIYYFENSKDKNIADKLDILLMLEGKWSPTPDDIIKMNKIAKELEGLIA